MAVRRHAVNGETSAPVAHEHVYAETTAASVDVFVRDRGAGFAVDGVAADRHGVRNSIIDRMARHGGSADVRSSPGEGTDVRLHLPRTARSTDEEKR